MHRRAGKADPRAGSRKRRLADSHPRDPRDSTFATRLLSEARLQEEPNRPPGVLVLPCQHLARDVPLRRDLSNRGMSALLQLAEQIWDRVGCRLLWKQA